MTTQHNGHHQHQPMPKQNGLHPAATAPHAPPHPKTNHTTTRHRRHKPPNFTCRRACFYSLLLLIAVILLTAVAAAAFCLLYHPQKPQFSVTSVRISVFNLTTSPSDDSTHLTTKLNVTLSTKNSNDRITFRYKPISLTLFHRSTTLLANGSFGNFTGLPGKIDVIHTAMGIDSEFLEGGPARELAADLKKRNGLTMEIGLEGGVDVTMGRLKLMNVLRIGVGCGGVRWEGRKVNSSSADIDSAKCRVDFSFSIGNLKFLSF